MSEDKSPVLFCNTYPSLGASGSLTLKPPFGLPEYNIEVAADLQAGVDLTTCNSLYISLGNINASLSALMPLIKLAGCVFKLFEIVKAIPDSIGPPPNPTKVIKKIAAFKDCIDLFMSFALLLEIPKIALFLSGLLTLVIAILTCVKQMLKITIDNDKEIAALKASADIELNDLGACLEVQNDALKAELNAKLNGLQAVVLLINVFLTIAQQDTIQVDGNSFTLKIDILDNTIAILDVARQALFKIGGQQLNLQV